PVAPLVVGNVLGNINRGAAILSTERQPLKHADGDQRDGSEPTGSRVTGHAADEESSKTHYRESDQKGVFTSDQIADATKEERPERSHKESDGEGGKVRDESKRRVPGWIELLRQDYRKASKNIEVIPLDHRADRRGQNHTPDAVLRGSANCDCICPSSHTSSCWTLRWEQKATWKHHPRSTTSAHTSPWAGHPTRVHPWLMLKRRGYRL